MKRDLKYEKLKLDLILGRADEKKLLSNLKYEYNYYQIDSIINSVYNKNIRGYETLFTNILPSNYTKLRQCNNLYRRVSFEKEIIWNIILISKFSDQINRFVILQNEYEIKLLNGEYKQAENILSKIESDICFSIWTLENRFILEELRYGLENNKEFLNKINQMDNDNILLFLAELLSFKAEKDISEVQYNNRISKLLKRTNNEVIKSYFKFKFYNIESYSYTDYSNILYLEGTSSIIDRYLAFIRICQMLCSQENIDLKVRTIINKCISNLHLKVQDSNLENLYLYFNPTGISKMNDLSKSMNEIGERYTEGEYDECYNLCKNKILSNSNCFEVYEYLIKSMLHITEEFIEFIDKDCLLYDILESVYNAYIKKDYTIKSYRNLRKYIRIIGNSNFGLQLLNFFVNRFATQKTREITILSELNTKFHNARFNLVYNLVQERLNFLNGYKDIYGDSQQLRLFYFYNCNILSNSKDIIYLDNLNGIPEIRKKLYIAQIMKYKSNYLAAINEFNFILQNFLKDLNVNQKSYIYEKIVFELFNCYLTSNMYEENLELYVNNYLENFNMTIRIDIKELINTLDKNLNTTLKSKIDLPILMHIYYKNQSSKIYPAYANFLYASDVKKPSDLINSSNFERSKLIYFLKNVCTVDVLDSSYRIFDTEEKVDNERITICQFLKNIDSERESEYIKEISELTQKYSINKRIQQLDESKIDIDIKSIKSDMKDLFNDNFKRYMEMGTFEKSFNIIDLYNIIGISIDDTKENSKKQIVKQKQQFILFKEMFLDLRDKFTFSEYGLDSSLSTRIRHGRLQNQIRSLFEFYNLINSKKSHTSIDYNKNEYWENRMEKDELGTNGRTKLHKSLSAFSQFVDNKIEEINNKWIKIKTEDKNQEGLFDFKFLDDELSVYYTVTTEMNSDEILFDFIVELLWKRTEKSLKSIREKLSNILKEEFINQLNSFEKNIIEMIDNNNKSKILLELKQNVINCRTDIQTEIEKIAEWFMIPKNQESIDYNFDQLISTCTAINKKLYNNYDEIQITVTNTSRIILKGSTFSYLVDILIILFSNAITHSCMREIRKLRIVLDINEQEDGVHIMMKNNLSDEVNLDRVIERIYETQKKISDIKSNKMYYSYEGGSGYVKIAKILIYNLRTSGFKVYSGIDEQNNYYVDILLIRKGIVTESEGDLFENSCS